MTNRKHIINVYLRLIHSFLFYLTMLFQLPMYVASVNDFFELWNINIHIKNSTYNLQPWYLPGKCK
jgi:hypothetical protein